MRKYDVLYVTMIGRSKPTLVWVTKRLCSMVQVFNNAEPDLNSYVIFPGTRDWDFPRTFPFVYRISKDNTPVDINQVIKWYESLIKEHPNYSMEMRKYAEENLSWDAKMKPVIEKIKELARKKERKPTA